MSSTLNGSGPPGTSFLHDLRAAAGSAMVREIDLTCRIGVLSAGGLSRAEILSSLRVAGHEVDELDIRMAIKRLQKIAGDWR